MVDQIIPGHHRDQILAVYGDRLQGVGVGVELPEVRDGVHDLPAVGVLVDLQGAVPGGGQIDLLVEVQPEGEVLHLVPGVVGHGEVIGVGLEVVLGAALVVQVEELGPGAASGRRGDGDLLVPEGVRGEESLAGKRRLVPDAVVGVGLDHAHCQDGDGNEQGDEKNQRCSFSGFSTHGYPPTTFVVSTKSIADGFGIVKSVLGSAREKAAAGTKNGAEASGASVPFLCFAGRQADQISVSASPPRNLGRLLPVFFHWAYSAVAVKMASAEELTAVSMLS